MVGADRPLIGFAGAPFTVASYLIEGSRRGPARTKALMLGDRGPLARTARRLADLAATRCGPGGSGRAGRPAVRLVGGALSPADYEARPPPLAANVFDGLADLGVPGIHFGVGTGELLGLPGGPGDVVGVDWRSTSPPGASCIGAGREALQGNLDPAVLLAPLDVVETQVRGAGRQRRAARSRVQPRPRRPPGDRPAPFEHVVELVHVAP